MNTETMVAKSRIHPLMAGAAVALIIASAAATAALMGWLPGSNAEKAEQQAAAAPATSAAPAAPAQSSGNPAPAAKHSQPVHVAAAPSVAQQKAHCATCGVVTAVHEVEIKGEGSGGGALAGGAAGALLGSGLTHGNKNSNVVAVVGGVAGAVVGNEVEKRAKTHKRYDVAVRMEDGSTKTMSYEQAPAWKSGDRVRVADGKLTPQ